MYDISMHLVRNTLNFKAIKSAHHPAPSADFLSKILHIVVCAQQSQAIILHGTNSRQFKFKFF